MFLRQIWGDTMLAVCCAAPLLAACFFRFGVPALESLLCAYLLKAAVLRPFYPLFDLFLSGLTPYMLCFASAMVMLSEFDIGLSAYFSVTPVGKRGYLFSRLFIPAGFSFLVSLVLVRFFSLAPRPLVLAASICLLSCILGVIAALFIFAFSRVQYLFSFLPSFWIAKLTLDKNLLFFFPALAVSALWLFSLTHKFTRKLSR
jgi:fluoroquinolone transport system permease protein